jgi:hypothetical protein
MYLYLHAERRPIQKHFSLKKNEMKSSQKRIFTTISLFSFLALFPMGCDLFCTDSCGCGSTVAPKDFFVESFSVFTVNESGVELDETNTFPYDKIFKTFQIEDVKFTSQKRESANSFTFGTALACSPIPPQSANTLIQIQLINQKEFTLADGQIVPVGDDITAFFGVNNFFAAGLKDFESLVESGLRLTNEDYFKIGFLNNPEKELNLEFTIRFEFDDAQEILLTDQILNIR